MDMLFNELPTAFPIYDKLEKQTRYHFNDFKTNYDVLISPANALPSFQFKISLEQAKQVQRVYLVKECSGVELEITDYMNFRYYILESGFYIKYFGDVLQSGEDELFILPSNYYLRIEFSESENYYSEIFKVPEERFKKNESNRYLKIEYSASSDLNPISYKDGWKQEIYLDSFIYKSEPEIEEDGEKDGVNNTIPNFQKLTLKYNFVAFVPDYLKIALVSLQIHNKINITSNNNLRSGFVNDCEVTFTDEAGGFISEVSVKFIQYIITKNACDEQIPNFVVDDGVFSIEEITNDNTNAYIFANLQRGFVYDIIFDEHELYKSNLSVKDFENGYKIPLEDVGVQIRKKTISGDIIQTSNLVNVM